MKKLLPLLVFIVISCSEEKDIVQQDLTQYVNTFTGTIDGGQVCPGACVPFGMVRLVSDNGTMISNYGYQADGTRINGFGHIHISGTGGQPKYGNIIVMPWIGKVNPESHSDEPFNYVARPGYFNVYLAENKINVELTSTQSVGFHKYLFTKPGDAKILFDMGMCQGMFLNPNDSGTQKLISSEIKVLSNTEVEGYTEVKGGWNWGQYKVYFYAVVNTPADSFRIWKDKSVLNDQKEISGNFETGSYFCYNVQKSQRILMKVGVSFISTQKAKENVERELNHWDFEKVMLAGKDQWQQTLSKIIVKGGSEEWKQVFYTSLYRCFTMPTNRTGENPLWKSDEPYYDDFYCIWDSYRSQNPLLSIIAPSKESEIVRALVDIYKHEGYMPDGRSGNVTGMTQGGSNCDVVVAEGILKDLPNINLENAYEALKKDAEVEPANGMKWGRSNLEFYKEHGFIPAACTSSVSKVLEYAYNDYCIALVAKKMGKKEDYDKYIKRSTNWMNVWNANMTDHGAKGFAWPKEENGNFVDEWLTPETYSTKIRVKQKFTTQTIGCWSGAFYESNSWEYSFYVPHNMNKLIELCGGPGAFESRLDTFFINEYYNVWNEPGFMTPCLYDYIHKQAKTAAIVDKTRRKYYNTAINGIPGNDDSGTMAAWFVFHALGFFPVSGQDVYLISSPLFEEATINLENGKTFIIRAKNVSEKNIYIQNAKLNGKALNRAWLKHKEIVNGGKLEFEMGNQPAAWDNGELPAAME